jgi:hypothetical protein
MFFDRGMRWLVKMLMWMGIIFHYGKYCTLYLSPHASDPEE